MLGQATGGTSRRRKTPKSEPVLRPPKLASEQRTPVVCAVGSAPAYCALPLTERGAFQAHLGRITYGLDCSDQCPEVFVVVPNEDAVADLNGIGSHPYSAG